MFVWAELVCGTREYQSAPVDCSGVIQKIHMRKIGRDQGRVHDVEYGRFHDERPLDKPKWPSHGPGVRADAQCRCAGL